MGDMGPSKSIATRRWSVAAMRLMASSSSGERVNGVEAGRSGVIAHDFLAQRCQEIGGPMVDVVVEDLFAHCLHSSSCFLGREVYGFHDGALHPVDIMRVYQ